MHGLLAPGKGRRLDGEATTRRNRGLADGYRGRLTAPLQQTRMLRRLTDLLRLNVAVIGGSGCRRCWPEAKSKHRAFDTAWYGNIDIASCCGSQGPSLGKKNRSPCSVGSS